MEYGCGGTDILHRRSFLSWRGRYSVEGTEYILTTLFMDVFES
jgi:hypothetical protein